MTGDRMSGGHGLGLWVYVLAGPPVGTALTLWLLGASPLTPALILAGLPPAYALGLAPALLIGALDRRLEQGAADPARRVVAVAAAGAACGLAVLAPLYSADLVRGPAPLLLSLAAAVAAIACLSLVLVVQRLFR